MTMTFHESISEISQYSELAKLEKILYMIASLKTRIRHNEEQIILFRDKLELPFSKYIGKDMMYKNMMKRIQNYYNKHVENLTKF